MKINKMVIKTLFFGLILSFANTSYSFNKYLHYDIHYLKNSEYPCLSVQLNSTINEKGKSSLIVPVGVQELSFRLNGSETKMPRSSEEYITVISGAPGTSFEAKYQFCLINLLKSIQAPNIERNSFSFRMPMVFISPVDHSKTPWDIRIQLSKMPKDFKLFSSYPIYDKTIGIHQSLDHFKNSILMGGSDLKHDKIVVNGQTIHLVTGGKITIDESPKYYLKKLITAHRNFWNDNDFTHYLVSYQKFGCENNIPLTGVTMKMQ